MWVACPTAAEAVDALRPAAVVYQRTDRYECYRGVNAERIAGYDSWLKARADLTIFCSTALYDAEAGDCRHACLIDHGVDLERFVEAAEGGIPLPADVTGLPEPRVGFIGGIDDHTFDPIFPPGGQILVDDVVAVSARSQRAEVHHISGVNTAFPPGLV